MAMSETSCPLLCKEESLFDVQDEGPGSNASTQDAFSMASPTFRHRLVAAAQPALALKDLQDEIRYLRRREMQLVPVLSARGWVISMSDRSAVVSCICKIIDACQMSFETRMLAVNIFDRYITSLERTCQDSPILLAMACVQAAAKMEENNFQNFYIAHILRCFSQSLDFKELARMEAVVVKALDWKLSGPTFASLLEPIMLLISPQLESLYDICLDDFQAYTQQLCAAALQDAYFATVTPSHMALAVLQTALLELGLSRPAIADLMQPAEALISSPELLKVHRVQDYLSYKMQTSPCKAQTQHTAPIEKACGRRPALTEESPSKRHKPYQETPNSVLNLLQVSPQSVDGMCCGESPVGLYDYDY